MKKIRKIIPVLCILLSFNACIVDDDVVEPQDTPELQRGDVEANRFEIKFTPKSGGGPSKTFEFYDTDGSGGNTPVTNETWELSFSSSGGIQSYDASIKFYLDSKEVTEQIDNRASNYIVCYRDMNTDNFRVNDSNLDSDGLRLGTQTTWQVIDDANNSGSESGSVRVTLNYIHLRKEGICDAGVRIFETTINYQHQ